MTIRIVFGRIPNPGETWSCSSGAVVVSHVLHGKVNFFTNESSGAMSLEDFCATYALDTAAGRVG